jgi:hypothetical protein
VRLWLRDRPEKEIVGESSFSPYGLLDITLHVTCIDLLMLGLVVAHGDILRCIVDGRNSPRVS